ncbi:hypothetical protein, partial [Secundilactobacillus odoratitofui]|uniref:hypothetical protein n=1 Tax=Secundilactobacillus odoratitofui TaxID=480930 RepID=UPI00138F44E0
TQITKDWPDGDKTVVDINTDTNTATVTETPKGEPSLPAETVEPGNAVTVGHTAVTNNEPNGIQLEHNTDTGTSEIPTGIETTTVPGKTTETINPDGSKTMTQTG